MQRKFLHAIVDDGGGIIGQVFEPLVFDDLPPLPDAPPGPAGPQGPQGDQGPKGDQGPPGIPSGDLHAIQFGLGTSFGGSNDFTFDEQTGRLYLQGSFYLNGLFGMGNAEPHGPQTCAGATSAGSEYGDNERAMLQSVYDALRAFGLLTP